MTLQERILEALQEKDLTVNELTQKLGSKNNNVIRTQVNRLKNKNLIDMIRVEGNERVYGLIKKKETPECVKMLKFLNNFFKDNIEYLSKNIKISNFIEEHEEFDKIEEMIK